MRAGPKKVLTGRLSDILGTRQPQGCCSLSCLGADAYEPSSVTYSCPGDKDFALGH